MLFILATQLYCVLCRLGVSHPVGICGVVGYHVRFTRGRSPVRTRTDVSFLIDGRALARLGHFWDCSQKRSTYGLVGYDVRLTRGRSPVRSWVGVFYGSLAQMVEHWSNKPRVMGSIPIGTILLIILFYLSANSF